MDTTPEQLEFLKVFDLAHGERRLRFVIDGLNHLYAHAGTEGYPDREEIDSAKGRLWDAVGTLRDAMSGAGFDETLVGHFDTCFAVEPMREFMERTGFDPEEYVDEHRKKLDALEVALREHLKTTDVRLHGRPLHQPAPADGGLEQRAPLGSPRALPGLSVLGRAPLPGPVAERRRRARPRRDRAHQPARHEPHPGRGRPASAASSSARRRATSARSSAVPAASRTTSGAAWTVPSASSGSCSTAPPRQTCSAGATRRSARSSRRTSRRCRKPRSSSSTCARRSAPRRACQTGASDLPSKCGPASGERRA